MHSSRKEGEIIITDYYMPRSAPWKNGAERAIKNQRPFSPLSLPENFRPVRSGIVGLTPGVIFEIARFSFSFFRAKYDSSKQIPRQMKNDFPKRAASVQTNLRKSPNTRSNIKRYSTCVKCNPLQIELFSRRRRPQLSLLRQSTCCQSEL